MGATATFTFVEVNVTEVKPGDIIVYGGRDARVSDQWTWGNEWSDGPDENVGLKLDGYIGYVHLSRHDTVRKQFVVTLQHPSATLNIHPEHQQESKP